MPHPTLREIAIEVAGRFCPRPDCQLNIPSTTTNPTNPAMIFSRDGTFRLDDYSTCYQNSILCYSCDRRYLCRTWFHQTNYFEVTHQPPPGP